MDACQAGVLSFEHLRAKIEPIYLNQFRQASPQFAFFTSNQEEQLHLVMLEWLGFFELHNINIKNSSISRKQPDLLGQKMNEMSLVTHKQTEIDSEEEDDEYSHERMLEQDFEDFARIKSSKPEKNNTNMNNSSWNILFQLIEMNAHDGWKIKGNNDKPKNIAKKSDAHLRKIIGHTAKSAANMSSNIWQIAKEDRFCLYNKWLAEVKAPFHEFVSRYQSDYNKTVESLNELRMQEDREIMQSNSIIYIYLIRKNKKKKIIFLKILSLLQ